MDMNGEAKEVFTPGLMITFRTARKLRSYLVRVKLCPLQRVTGSCKCNDKHCAVCLNFNETTTFTSSVTHETYEIKNGMIND